MTLPGHNDLQQIEGGGQHESAGGNDQPSSCRRAAKNFKLSIVKMAVMMVLKFGVAYASLPAARITMALSSDTRATRIF